MVWNLVVATPHLREEILCGTVKERVMSHQESVEDDTKAPQVSSLSRIAPRLKHLGTHIRWTAMPVCKLA